jgi:hypothetical protein
MTSASVADAIVGRRGSLRFDNDVGADRAAEPDGLPKLASAPDLRPVRDRGTVMARSLGSTRLPPGRRSTRASGENHLRPRVV